MMQKWAVALWIFQKALHEKKKKKEQKKGLYMQAPR